MKKMIMVMVLAASTTAFAKKEKAVVCGDNLGQEICFEIEYKVRPSTGGGVAPIRCGDEMGGFYECPNVTEAGGILRKLNDWFHKKGFKTPANPYEHPISGE